MIVYISSQCPNCQRVMDISRRAPSLSKTLQFKDIDTLAPAERSRLQYVPTLVDTHGREYVGSKVFEFLKQFESEMELEPAPFGMHGALEFSSFDDNGGQSERNLHYSSF